MMIGEKMRAERLRLKLKQSELAERIGCSASLVSAWETNEREPSLTWLKKFCVAVGIRLGSMFETEDDLPHEMTINEYQQKAMRTAEEKGRTWSNVALGLCGESGEVADHIKKYLHQGHPLDHDKLLEEIGDVAWYLALAATVAGVTLESVLVANIEKLNGRYPEGFDPERSLHREDEP